MFTRRNSHFKFGSFLLMILCLKQPRVEGCRDTMDVHACDFMKRFNYCEADIKYLKEKCDKSCGWCSEGNECKDYGKYIDCESLTQNECDQDIPKYYTRCRKSCNWCDKDLGAVWDTWSKWSRCSEPCGYGAQSRQRSCLSGNCRGKSSEIRSCILRKCPSWSVWGEWSECSASCNGGERTRTRFCDYGGSCGGDSSETEKCNTHNCEDLVLGYWGVCSRSCGGGTRTKVLNCSLNDINKCPRTYQDCNMFKCPKKKCDNHRYKSNSACCDYEERATCGKDKTVAERVLGGSPITVDMFPWMVRRRRNAPVSSTSFSFAPEIFPTFQTSMLIGGVQSERAQFPWMARIEVATGPFSKRTKCGGSLIHLQYVVTAAHCLTGWNKKELQVVLGSSRTKDTSPLIQRIGVQELYIHPNYSFPSNDVAVLKLKRTAIQNDRVDIICLPNGEEPKVDSECWIAGWGLTNPFSNTASKVLMEGKVRYLPYGVCESGYGRSGYGVFMDKKKMTCAGIISGSVDTCRGDSGGPLMCQRCSSCSWFLAGVTSFGPKRCGTAQRPGVYARMTTYETWVKTIVTPSETSTFTCLS